MGERRKTINGDDLLYALNTLGFEKYLDALRVYLNKYRETIKGEVREVPSNQSEIAKREDYS
jgi:nuclear transcription Y subunit beta